MSEIPPDLRRIRLITADLQERLTDSPTFPERGIAPVKGRGDTTT